MQDMSSSTINMSSVLLETKPIKGEIYRFLTLLFCFSVFNLFSQFHKYILFIWEKATSEGWNVIYGKLSHNTGANDTFNALELPIYFVAATRQEWSL